MAKATNPNKPPRTPPGITVRWSKRRGAFVFDVRLRDLNGKPYTRTTPTLDRAKSLQASERADRDRGEYVDPAKRRRLFGDYAGLWLATKVPPNTKPKTHARYRSALKCHVRPRFGALPVGAVDHAVVRAFLAELSTAGYARGTVANCRAVLSGVLGFAADAGAIKANPARGARIANAAEPERVFLTAAQVEDLSHAIEFPPIETGGGEHRRESYPECALAVRVAAYAGLRAGELWALRVGDVDTLRQRVHVNASLSDADGVRSFEATKNYQRRTVPIPAALVDEIVAHVAACGRRRDDLLFTDRDGGPVWHGNFYRRHYVPAVERAGLPAGTNFHSLRHTAAAMLATWGFSEAEVTRHLGHRHPVSTYRHLWDDGGDRVRDALDATLREAMADAATRRCAGVEPGNIRDFARDERAMKRPGRRAVAAG